MSNYKKILVTGGAGFIGSHLAAAVGVGQSMYEIEHRLL